MSKINILSAQVYNRIAAGEVVDRPYSVVKELVENAIDAGATEIEIYIERGGKQLIRVVDNGCGIARDDLHAAFMPHATSKIEKATDLENILTLGFRGEAVASIAAVSKMTITSKEQGAKCYSLFSNGGELGEIVEAAGEDGTDVKVEMLFFNTPVRLGFLKSDKGEETDIVNYVSRFILNRSDISFRLFVDGKQTLQSFGGGEEEALVNVYGTNTLKNCLRIDGERNGIRVRGYIGNHNFFKANKTYQSAFLNGRYIVNATITSAIMRAYESYLMKRQYPFYVLHIEMPVETVDVNVHPNKADVRFFDNRVVYGAIYNVVSAVLDGKAKALDYVDQSSLDVQTASVTGADDSLKGGEGPFAPTSTGLPSWLKEETPKVDEKKTGADNQAGVIPAAGFTYEDALKEMERHAPMIPAKKRDADIPELPFDVSESSGNKSASGRFGDSYEAGMVVRNGALVENARIPKKAKTLQEMYPEYSSQEEELEVNDSQKTEGSPDSFQAAMDAQSGNGQSVTSEKRDEDGVDYFAENKRYLEAEEAKARQNRIDVSACSYAGKLFNTYLLYERADEFYIIDQHAAHERLVFNRLKEQMKNRRVMQQPMLLPYNLELNAMEYAFIRENLSAIREIGFEIEEFGDKSFRIFAVPLDLQNINLASFFSDILSDISGYRAIRLEELLKDKLATAACKAAVKGGMDLTREEIDELFRLMDGDMGLKCPHGRPVVVRMTKSQLEKMFKRIV